MDKLVSDINFVKKDIETIRRNICGYIENSNEFKNLSVCKNDKGYIIKQNQGIILPHIMVILI